MKQHGFYVILNLKKGNKNTRRYNRKREIKVAIDFAARSGRREVFLLRLSEISHCFSDIIFFMSLAVYNERDIRYLYVNGI